MTVLSAGDISFVVTCTILVFLMTPGLALFYGGMVRKRNVLSIMMQSYNSNGTFCGYDSQSSRQKRFN